MAAAFVSFPEILLSVRDFRERTPRDTLALRIRKAGDRMSPWLVTTASYPFRINDLCFGARYALTTGIMHFQRETMQLSIELNSLRIALLMHSVGEPGRAVADPVSAAVVMEPQYVSGQPTQQMTAIWGT